MTLAAMSGLLAVAFGAFAAHALAEHRAQELMKTGASYEFMHAMASLACATFMQVGARKARFAPAFFLSGTVFFSGSLYALALGAPRWTGAITPVGGVLFIAGWAIMVWAARDVDQPLA